RKRLLANALEYYQEFARKHAGDPTFLAELTATYLKIAILMYELGSGEEWVPFLEKGVEAMEALVATGPSLKDLRPLHAGALWVNAGGRWHVGRSGNAHLAFQSASRHLERLARQYPEVPGFRNDLAVLYLGLGVMTGPRKAVEHYQRARDLLLGLIRED